MKPIMKVFPFCENCDSFEGIVSQNPDKNAGETVVEIHCGNEHICKKIAVIREWLNENGTPCEEWNEENISPDKGYN